MDKISIVYIGSGCLAIPVLDALCRRGRDEILAVTTQPDRPSGRSRKIKSCPLKPVAIEHDLTYHTPDSINDEGMLEKIRSYEPDLFIVADYGQILSKELLSIPKKGSVNVHPSLLPKYRGAAPVQWALINGESETGVTIQYVAEKMDAGDIIVQSTVQIEPDDNTESLQTRLGAIAADMLLDVIDDIRSGAVRARPQDDDFATYAPKLKKIDGAVDFSGVAMNIANRVRGMYPWPCCYCEMRNGLRLRILKAEYENLNGAPRTVLDIDSQGPLIACEYGSLRLVEVQPAGRKRMTGLDFCNGYKLKSGEKI